MSGAVKLVERLMQSPYKFYLGGSRRMAQLHPTEVRIIREDHTDYDLYVTYDPQVENWLLSKPNDFLITHSAAGGYPLDNEAVKILVHEDCACQIVMRKDAEFYRKVFEAIPVKFYKSHLWKSSPEHVVDVSTESIMATFDALFAVAHAQETTTTFNPPATPRDPVKAYEAAMKGLI